MEEDERKKKLRAGKEKLAAFRKKKSKRKRQSDVAEGGVDGAVSPDRSETLSSTDYTSSSDVPSCDDSDSFSGDEMMGQVDMRLLMKTQAELHRAEDRISELEESLMGKQLALDRAIQENSQLRENPDFKKMEELEEAILKRDEIIRQLSTQIQPGLVSEEQQHYRVETEQLAQQVQLLHVQLQNADKLLQSHTEKQATSTQAMQDAKNQIITLQKTINEKDQILNQLVQKLNIFTEEYSSLKNSYETIKQRESETNEVVKQLMSDAEEMRKQAKQNGNVSRQKTDEEEVEKRLEMMRSELEEKYGFQIAEMKREIIQQYNVEKDRLLNEKDSLSVELAKIREEYKTVNQQSDEYQRERDSLSDELDKISEDYEKVTNQAREYEHRLLEFQGVINQTSDLQQECQLLRVQNDELKNKINIQQDSVVGLKAELEILASENSKFKEQMSYFTQELDTQSNELAVALHEKSKFAEQVSSLENELTVARQEIKSYNEKVVNFQESIGNLQADLQNSEKINHDLKMQCQELKDQEKERTIEEEKKDHEIDMLKSQLAGFIEREIISETVSDLYVERKSKDDLSVEDQSEKRAERRNSPELMASQEQQVLEIIDKVLEADDNLCETDNDLSETDYRVLDKNNIIYKTNIDSLETEQHLFDTANIVCETNQMLSETDNSMLDSDDILCETNDIFSETDSKVLELSENRLLHSLQVQEQSDRSGHVPMDLDSGTQPSSNVDSSLSRGFDITELLPEISEIHFSPVSEINSDIVYSGPVEKDSGICQSNFESKLSDHQSNLETKDHLSMGSDSRMLDSDHFTSEIEKLVQENTAHKSSIQKLKKQVQLLHQQLAVVKKERELIQTELDKLKNEDSEQTRISQQNDITDVVLSERGKSSGDGSLKGEKEIVEEPDISVEGSVKTRESEPGVGGIKPNESASEIEMLSEEKVSVDLQETNANVGESLETDNTVQQLQAKIEKFKSMEADLKAENEELKECVSSLKLKVEELQMCEHDWKVLKEELDETVDSKEKDFQKMVEEQMAEQHEFDTEKDELVKINNDLKEKVAELLACEQNLKDDCELLEEKCKIFESEIEDYKINEEKMKVDSKKLKEVVLNLNIRVEELEQCKESLTSEKEDMEIRIKMLEKAEEVVIGEEQLKVENEELQDMISDFKGKVESLTTEKNMFEEKAHELEKMIEDKLSGDQELMDMDESLRIKMEELTHLISEKEERLKDVESKYEADIEILKSENQNLIKSLEDDLKKASEREEVLQANAEKVRYEMDALVKTNEELIRQINELNNSVEPHHRIDTEGLVEENVNSDGRLVCENVYNTMADKPVITTDISSDIHVPLSSEIEGKSARKNLMRQFSKDSLEERGSSSERDVPEVEIPSLIQETEDADMVRKCMLTSDGQPVVTSDGQSVAMCSADNVDDLNSFTNNSKQNSGVENVSKCSLNFETDSNFNVVQSDDSVKSYKESIVGGENYFDIDLNRIQNQNSVLLDKFKSLQDKGHFDSVDLTDLENIVKENCEKISGLKMLFAKLSQEITSLEAIVVEKDTKIVALSSKNEELENASQHLLSRNGHLDADVHFYKEEIEKLRNEISNMSANEEKLKSKLCEVNDQNLSSQLNQLRQEYEALFQKNSELFQSVSELDALSVERFNENMKLKEQLASVEEKVREITPEKEEISDGRNTLSNLNSVLEQENMELKLKILEEGEKSESLKSNIDEFKQRLDILTEECVYLREENVKIKSENKEQVLILHNAQELKNELRQKMENLESLNDNLEYQNNSLRDECGRLNIQLLEKSQQNEILMSKQNTLQSENVALAKELESLSTRCRELESETTDLKVDLDQVKAEKEEKETLLNDVMELLQKEKTEFQSVVEEYQQAIKLLRNDLTEMKIELSEREKEIKETVLKLETMTSEKNELDLDLTRKVDKIAQLEKMLQLKDEESLKDPGVKEQQEPRELACATESKQHGIEEQIKNVQAEKVLLPLENCESPSENVEEELKSTIQKRDIHQQELEEMRQELQQLREKHTAAKISSRWMEEDLVASRNQVQKLEEKLAFSNKTEIFDETERSDMQAELDQFKSESKLLNNELKIKNEEIQVFKEEKSEFQSRIRELQDEIDYLKENQDDLESELETAAESLQTAVKQKGNSNMELEDLKKELFNLTEIRNDLMTQVDSLGSNLSESRKLGDELTLDLKKALFEKEKEANKNKQLLIEKKALKVKVERLESANSKMQVSLDELQQENSGIKRSIEELKKENDVLMQEVTKLKESSVKQKQELENEKEENLKHVASVKELLSVRDNMLQACKDLEQEVDQQGNKNKDLENQNQLIIEELENLKSKREALSKSNEMMTDCLTDLQSKYEEVRSLMENTQKEYSKEVDSLKSQLIKVNDDFENLHTSVEVLENDLLEKNKENIELMSRLQKECEMRKKLITEQEHVKSLTVKNRKDHENRSMMNVSQVDNNLVDNVNTIEVEVQTDITCMSGLDDLQTETIATFSELSPLATNSQGQDLNEVDSVDSIQNDSTQVQCSLLENTSVKMAGKCEILEDNELTDDVVREVDAVNLEGTSIMIVNQTENKGNEKLLNCSVLNSEMSTDQQQQNHVQMDDQVQAIVSEVRMENVVDDNDVNRPEVTGQRSDGDNELCPLTLTELQEKQLREKEQELTEKMNDSLKQKEYDLQEKYELMFRDKHAEMMVHYDKDKTDYQKEMEQVVKHKVEAVRAEKDQAFVKSLQRMRKDFDKKHKREMEKLRMKLLQEIAEGDDENGMEIKDVVQKLNMENQELAEARDALLQQVEQLSYYRQEHLQQDLNLIIGQHVGGVESDSCFRQEVGAGEEHFVPNRHQYRSQSLMLDWEFSPHSSFDYDMDGTDESLVDPGENVCLRPECQLLRHRLRVISEHLIEGFKPESSGSPESNSDYNPNEPGQGFKPEDDTTLIPVTDAFVTTPTSELERSFVKEALKVEAESAKEQRFTKKDSLSDDVFPSENEKSRRNIGENIMTSTPRHEKDGFISETTSNDSSNQNTPTNSPIRRSLTNQEDVFIAESNVAGLQNIGRLFEEKLSSTSEKNDQDILSENKIKRNLSAPEDVFIVENDNDDSFGIQVDNFRHAKSLPVRTSVAFVSDVTKSQRTEKSGVIDDVVTISEDVFISETAAINTSDKITPDRDKKGQLTLKMSKVKSSLSSDSNCAPGEEVINYLKTGDSNYIGEGFVSTEVTELQNDLDDLGKLSVDKSLSSKVSMTGDTKVSDSSEFDKLTNEIRVLKQEKTRFEEKLEEILKTYDKEKQDLLDECRGLRIKLQSESLCRQQLEQELIKFNEEFFEKTGQEDENEVQGKFDFIQGVKSEIPDKMDSGFEIMQDIVKEKDKIISNTETKLRLLEDSKHNSEKKCEELEKLVSSLEEIVKDKEEEIKDLNSDTELDLMEMDKTLYGVENQEKNEKALDSIRTESSEVSRYSGEKFRKQVVTLQQELDKKNKLIEELSLDGEVEVKLIKQKIVELEKLLADKDHYISKLEEELDHVTKMVNDQFDFVDYRAKMEQSFKEKEKYIKTLEEHFLKHDSLDSSGSPNRSSNLSDRSFRAASPSHTGYQATDSLETYRHYYISPNTRNQFPDVDFWNFSTSSTVSAQRSLFRGSGSSGSGRNLLSDQRSVSSCSGSYDDQDPIISGLGPEEDGHYALELKHFKLVDEISQLRRELRETKAVYNQENALLQEALDKEKIRKDLSSLSPKRELFAVDDTVKIIELKKNIAVLEESNRMLHIENDKWLKRIQEQECIVLELQAQTDSNVDDGRFERIYGQQIKQLQNQRNDLMERLRSVDVENTRLSFQLGEKAILEETLRREKDLLKAKLSEKEDIEKELKEKTTELEKQIQAQVKLEEILDHKNQVEKELMRQKRLLELELSEIECKLQEKEELLHMQKDQLMREMRDKDSSRRSSLCSSQSDLCSEASSYASSILSTQSSPAHVGRLDLMLSDAKKEHNQAVEYLKHKLKTDTTNPQDTHSQSKHRTPHSSLKSQHFRKVQRK